MDMIEKDKEFIKKVNNRIKDKKTNVENDYYRLNYHLMPPVGFMNDPNGFIQFNGEYHLFYQFNPFFPEYKQTCWGHYKSEDLVSWTSLPIALCPNDWYDKNGCYSGSAINKKGEFILIYTGNVKNCKGNRETYQCLATSKDGINFAKIPNNPVINKPEEYTEHFRDPKIWQKNNAFYTVIGAQTKEEKGCAVLFKSQNLINWEKVGEVATANTEANKHLGYMWECPDLFNLNNKDVLIFSPQGVEPLGNLYNNIYQCGYFIGTLDYEKGVFDHNSFVELDRGFEFYAPQTMVDDKKRRILIAWMGLPDEINHPTVEKQWIHCMTIPRELFIKNNKLIQKPVEEMKKLREALVSYENILIYNELLDFKDIVGDSIEIYLELENINASQFEIKLRCSEDGKEETVIKVDFIKKEFELNREKSGLGSKGIRKCKISTHNFIKLNIFIDKSSIEIFINEGEEVFTARIYPKKDSLGVKFLSHKGKVMIKKINKWTIN
ncbi:glycoside hydrolase family 32 protein [Clostridium botulinum]|uniref:glycoside hydrolase family 32 protein n=1 Tax=Clostridium botulinum TaxID=1491 RepID=UPI003A80A93D